MAILNLSGAQLEELLNAILDAFDVSSLEMLVRIKLDLDLGSNSRPLESCSS